MANNNYNNNNRKVKINEDVEKFATKTYKKFKKKDCYDDMSKKDIKKAYFEYLAERFPDAVLFTISYGHIPDDKVQETKNAIYAKFVDEDFVKRMTKEVKKNGTSIENIRLFPIVIREIVAAAEKANAEATATNPEAKVYDCTDLIDLSKLILKKRLKKMKEAGIDEEMAFELLSIAPCTKAFEISSHYRMRMLFDAMYEMAKGKAVPFGKIMEVLVDEEFYPAFIAFALLERKDRYANLTDGQKTLYRDITDWCFATMNDMKKDVIRNILNTYIKARKRDEQNGKDSTRRYALSTLPDEDGYHNIIKVMNQMLVDDENLKKYF